MTLFVRAVSVCDTKTTKFPINPYGQKIVGSQLDITQDPGSPSFVAFSSGDSQQLRPQHQSLGAWHWQVDILDFPSSFICLDTDRLRFWIFKVLLYGDLWVTAALLIGAVVLKVSQIIPWLVNSSPSYGEVDTMIDGTRKQCNICAIFFLSSFWHLSYTGCLQ